MLKRTHIRVLSLLLVLSLMLMVECPSDEMIAGIGMVPFMN